MAAYRPVIACNSGGPVESFKNGVTDSLFKLLYRIVFACTTVFLWRASKDIIPTKMNLRKKGMCVDTSCPFYHSENEDTAHLLIHCHFARQVWSASILGCRIPAGSNILDWIATNLQTNDEYGAQVCCYLMWKIWGARNKVEFKQLSSLPIEVASDALNALLDFTTANASQSKVKKLQFHTSLPSAQKVEVLCTLL